MWLDKAKGAVIDHSSGWHSLWIEEEIKFSLCALLRIRTMNCVLGSISAEDTSDGVWSFLSGNLRVSWADKLPPSLDSVLINKFHSNANITGHKL